MEIVGAAVGEVTGSTVVHVEREFEYLIHFRKSTNNLKDNIQQLTDTKRDVQALIDAALGNGELVKEAVQGWMARADLVLVQASKVSEEASVINSWFRGWCCGRFSLGRKAQKTIEVIQRISEERNGFGDNVSQRKPTQSLNLVGAEDFSAFASRDLIAEKICKALLDDETNLVGVYGMPGVGKTILIKAIAKQVKENRLFEEVVVVIVSQNPSLLKLQGDIAEGLDLILTGDNLSRRAERLYDRLNQNDKTTLIILDDVWERIELSDVGIPYRNAGKCCKVVFTTRFRAVCDTMEANTNMEVEVLSEEDSWILFQMRFGNVADSSLARDVLKECQGLPLAIVTLGRALRNKDARVWADTLVQLRKSTFKGMSSVVSSIKLSYDFLESQSVKICFLFCCLFPEDHKIKLDVLLMFMMGEKLIEDVYTFDEASGRLHSIVDELISSGLLLRDEEENIMLHDVVRDVAISISAEEEGHVVKAGSNLSDWPDINLGNCKRLSMMYNLIEHFPSISIKAPNLQALFLNNNFNLTDLPSDIFADMKSLITLDLSVTNIKSLPPSSSCLENLCTLLLNHTKLQNLSPISKLERLEVLSVRNTKFTNKKVIEEIGNLSNLRILDLAWTSLSHSIRPSLFSKLSRLEEFHALDEENLQSDESRGIDILREIGSLSRLTSLELQICNPELCEIDIPGPWQNLTRFKIDIKTNDYKSFSFESDYLRSLCLNGIRGKQVANWVLMLLGRTNYLDLSCCEDLQSFTEVGAAAAKGMNENLKLLELRECSKMECLVSSNTQSSQNTFLSNLEHLRMVIMDAFVELCKGTPPQRLLCNLKTLSFSFCHGMHTAIPRKLIKNLRNLESLKILNCYNLLHVVEPEESLVSSNVSRICEPSPKFLNLKVVRIWASSKVRYVFTMKVARDLFHLEELEISECSEMEVIFKYEDGEDIQFKEDTAILPCLKMLNVWNAAKLKSFTNQNLVLKFPSLEHLKMSDCGMLERLPFGTTSVPNLSTFKVKEELFDRLEWDDESVKARLQAIKEE